MHPLRNPIAAADVSASPIETSLELAAERAGDLTPLVYARLFAEQPAVEALFWRDKNGSIRGEMLAKVFEAILDFVGERQYAEHLIKASVFVHGEYDVPRDIFRTFFRVVADAVRDVLDDAWTREMDGAWAAMLAELDTYIEAA